MAIMPQIYKNAEVSTVLSGKSLYNGLYLQKIKAVIRYWSYKNIGGGINLIVPSFLHFSSREIKSMLAGNKVYEYFITD